MKEDEDEIGIGFDDVEKRGKENCDCGWKEDFIVFLLRLWNIKIIILLDKKIDMDNSLST